MNDFFDRLALRALAPERAIQPRLQGLFEPPAETGGPLLAEVEETRPGRPDVPVPEPPPRIDPSPRVEEVPRRLATSDPSPAARPLPRTAAPPLPAAVAPPEAGRPATPRIAAPRTAAPPPATVPDLPMPPPPVRRRSREAVPVLPEALPSAVPPAAAVEAMRRPPPVAPPPAAAEKRADEEASEFVFRHRVERRTEIVERHAAIPPPPAVASPLTVREPPSTGREAPRVMPRVEPPPPVFPPPPTPTVRVTIGRLEVRATAPERPPRRERRTTPAVMSLDDYLKQRAGGGR